MAAELPRVIDEELLCCPLCMRSFREPRILPCLHTFCRVCLEKHLIIKPKPALKTKPLRFTSTGIDPSKKVLSNKVSPVKDSKKEGIKERPEVEDNGKKEASIKERRAIPTPGPPSTPVRHRERHEIYEECNLYEDVDPHSTSNHQMGQVQNVYEEPKEAEKSSTKNDTRSSPTQHKTLPSPSMGKIVNSLFKRFPVRKVKEDKQKIPPPEVPQLMPRRTSLPERGHSPFTPKHRPVPNTGHMTRRPVPLPPPDVIMGDPTFHNKVSLDLDLESCHSEDSYSVPQEPVGFLPDDHYTPPPEVACRRGENISDDTSYLSATGSSSHSLCTSPDEDEYLAPLPSVASDTTSTQTNDSTKSGNEPIGSDAEEEPSPQIKENHLPLSPKSTVTSNTGDAISGNPAIVRPIRKSPGPVPDPEQEVPSDLWSHCPLCDSSFQLPSPGIKGLKDNSFLTRLQEVVLSQNNVEKKCNNCETASARYRCLDCRHYLCGGCRDAHNWLKITRHHRVMTLGELRSGKFQRELTQKQEIKCETHKGNKVDLMCLFCDKPICYECKIQAHSDHRSGSLEEAAERDRDLIISLSKTVVQSKQQFDDTKTALNQYEKQCQDEKKELMDCLQHQKQSIINSINECFKDLGEEIEKAYTEELAYKDKIAVKIEGTISHMKHSCELAEQLLAHGKTEDILLMSKMIKVNLNNFSFTVPFELDTRPFVQYSPTAFDKKSLISLFGRLARRRHSVAKPKRVVRQTFELQRGETREHKDVVQIHTFRAKTMDDQLGCKPTGMTISTNDDIILVDDINKKIKVYDPAGVVKLEMCPRDENALIDPWDVTITYQGHLAVTDRGARKVKVFDACGNLMSEFGPHLKSPWGIAANSFGYLIVTDILAKTVFVNDQDGNLLYPIECRGHDKLFMCPEYVAINHNDDIIVSDFEKHCLTVFDSQGRYLYQYGSRGTGIHEFNVPCGICVDKKGHILAVDYTNRRIHVLTRDGQFERFLLTADHGLQTPQTIAVNSQGHLVVVDGTHIKIFGSSLDPDETEAESSKVYEPLQFDNRIYEGSMVRFSRLVSDSDA